MEKRKSTFQTQFRTVQNVPIHRTRFTVKTAFFLLRPVALVVLVLNLTACYRCEDCDLPPATQGGNGNFGCYIDGQRWTPYGGNWKLGSVVRYLADKKTLFVAGRNSNQDRGIAFGLANYEGKLGEYKLDSACTDLPTVCANFGSYSTYPGFDFNQYYWTDKILTGKVMITAHNERFISGTFEFEVRNRITNQTVKITKGRFDEWYRTY